MKKLIFLFAILVVFNTEAYACSAYGGEDLPLCPCVEVYVESASQAHDLAQACGQSSSCVSDQAVCSVAEFDGLLFGPVANCSCANPSQGEEYCYTEPLPPHPSGCCPDVLCYYILPAEDDDDDKDDEKTSGPSGGSSSSGPSGPAPTPSGPSGPTDDGGDGGGGGGGGGGACDQEGDPIHVLTGNSEQAEIDLQFGTPFEKGLSIYRTYKSRVQIDTVVGYGWTHNYNVTLMPVTVGQASLYLILDESSRKHYFQDTSGVGIYLNIGSSDSYLLIEADGCFTWHRGNGIIYTFDPTLKFVSKTDGSGNVQTLAYDVDGRLESVTDQASGRGIGFTYYADGRVEHIIGPTTQAVPDGIWVAYQYDSEGNLQYVTYADGNNGSTASGFEYKYEDPNDVHNLTEKRDLAGEFLSSWAYDSQVGWASPTI